MELKIIDDSGDVRLFDGGRLSVARGFEGELGDAVEFTRHAATGGGDERMRCGGEDETRGVAGGP